MVRLHLFLGDGLHHIHHADRDSNHEHHRAFKVNHRVEGLFHLEVLNLVRRLELQGVQETHALGSRVQSHQVSLVLFQVLVRCEFGWGLNFDDHWVKVKQWVEHFELVEARFRDVDFEV